VVVPRDYRLHASPIRRIGVAYNDSVESRAAVAAATDLARAFGASLELVAVVDAASFATPALMGGPSAVTMRQDIEHHVQESLDAMITDVAADVDATGVRLVGIPAEEIAERTAGLDLVVTGSRGYGPLRAVLTGGVSGRVLRSAQCPVLIVPRGVEAPLSDLFGGATASAV
jgi:nucleotide-binding universal stress UspA family protein